MLRLAALPLCLSTSFGNAALADASSHFIESALAYSVSADSQEHQLRELIAAHPAHAGLHFRLGTLLSRERRWPEARQAYARAEELAPGQADTQYNLAICLDHLEQTSAASQYYRSALFLAQRQPHNFPQATARQRLEQLLAALP
jgi:Flp pilus assembly protein TadD